MKSAGCIPTFGGGSMPKRKETLKTGYLIKKGHLRRNWLRRHFVLTNEKLSYFETAHSAKSKGAIMIKDIQRVRQCYHRARAACFEVATSEKQYVIQAPSEEEMREWISAIQRAQLTPSRLARLLKQTSDAFRAGSITNEERDACKSFLLSGHTDHIRRVEKRLETGRWILDESEAESDPSISDGGGDVNFDDLLDELHDCKTEADLIIAFRRLKRHASAAENKQGASAIVSTIASELHQVYVGEWTDRVATAYSRCIRAVRRIEPVISLSDAPDPDLPLPVAEGGEVAVPGCFNRKKAAPTAEPELVPSPPATSPVVVKERKNLRRCKLQDEYELHEVLGEGGYSVVRRAIHRATGEEVAIKVINTRTLKPRDVQNIYHEIRTMQELDHPNIVKLLEWTNEDGVVYIVTEMMKGGELFDQIVQRTYYSEKEARDLVKTLGGALAYLHEKGIVHRDIKPENILLSTTHPDAVVKLADMGFAKRMEVPDALKTACGTPSYVAPEIIEKHPYGKSVDMWSLGVITYILLCGYAPFHDPQHNHARLYSLIRRACFRFHSPYWDAISADAKALIRGLLKVNPKDRLTAEEVLKHPWISGNVQETDLSTAVREMRHFQAFRKRVVKRGFLKKKGHFVKNWKRRSFVLTGEALRYFENESTDRPRGTIVLSDITEVKDLPKKEQVQKARRHSFLIKTSAGKDFEIEADSAADKAEWMTAVMATQQQADLMEKARAAIDAEHVSDAVDLVKMANQWGEVRRSSLAMPPPVEDAKTSATAEGAPNSDSMFSSFRM